MSMRNQGFACLQPAPGSFQLLKRRVVQDFVELDRNQVVDLRYTGIDHRLGIPGHDHLALQVARSHFRSVVPLGRVARSHRGVTYETYDLYLASDPITPEQIFTPDQARR